MKVLGPCAAMGSSSLEASKRKRRRKRIHQRLTRKKLEDRLFSRRWRWALDQREKDVVRSRAFGSCLLGDSAS
jgi:hypothetical protein